MRQHVICIRSKFSEPEKLQECLSAALQAWLEEVRPQTIHAMKQSVLTSATPPTECLLILTILFKGYEEK
jgi:hypothetical protein